MKHQRRSRHSTSEKRCMIQKQRGVADKTAQETLCMGCGDEQQKLMESITKYVRSQRTRMKT